MKKSNWKIISMAVIGLQLLVNAELGAACKPDCDKVYKWCEKSCSVFDNLREKRRCENLCGDVTRECETLRAKKSDCDLLLDYCDSKCNGWLNDPVGKTRCEKVCISAYQECENTSK